MTQEMVNERFAERIFYTDSAKIFTEKEVPYSLEVLRDQARRFNRKFIQQEGMIIICTRNNMPTKEDILKAKKENNHFKYGRRIDPNGAMWDEPLTMYR